MKIITKNQLRATQLGALLLAGAVMGGALWQTRTISPLTRVAHADNEETMRPRNQAQLNALWPIIDALPTATAREAVWSQVGNAFDNGESRLFWFTDLDAARAQAKRENKPILSLRLLGNLSDEFSCANSRLFRVLLYPNASINKILREKYILHWSRERPVPVVTIDMGDGRVMKRTLTGNSAHYLLNADGAPLDVLPGLYAPAEFEKWLQGGVQLNDNWNAATPAARPQLVSEWHRARLAEVYQTSTSVPVVTQLIARDPLKNDVAVTRVGAGDASRLTETKMIGELPLLNQIAPAQTQAAFSIAANANRLFRSSNLPVSFDNATRARIAAMQNVSGPEANRLIQTLQNSVARDTSLNRSNFEPAIHAYFINEPTPDFDELNRAIYDKLFATPASDAWLGLKDDAAFTALQNNGIVNSQAQRVAQNP